jgi:paraquat-inducible protein B
MTRPKLLIVSSFIMGAFALGVVAILAVGGMGLLSHELRVAAVFGESIDGLDVGAPVTLRGTRIGRVGGMRLHIDMHRHTSRLPVYLDLDLDRISWEEGAVGAKRADLQAAVNAGLRAQLVSQGLVSGKSSVNLDYRPGTPARATDGPEGTFEIPTVPSDLQDLKDQVLRLDLPKIQFKVQKILADVQHVTQQLGVRIAPFADGLQRTLATTSEAVHQLQMSSARTLANVDFLAKESRRRMETNGSDLDRSLRLAEQAAGRADTLIESLNDMSGPRGDLQVSLHELAAGASSLRGLTHDLDEDPLGMLLRRRE